MTREMQVCAMHPLKMWLQPLRICQILKTNVLVSPLKEVLHPTVATCYLHRTAVVGNNPFSKTYVQERWFARWYRALYVIKVLIFWY